MHIQYDYLFSKTSKILVGYCLHFQVLHHPLMKFKIKSKSMSKLDLVRTKAIQKYPSNHAYLPVHMIDVFSPFH